MPFMTVEPTSVAVFWHQWQHHHDAGICVAEHRLLRFRLVRCNEHSRISATARWHCRVSTEIFDSVRCSSSLRSEGVELGFVNRRLDFARVSLPTSPLPAALTLPSTWRTLPVVDGSLYNSIAVSPAASVDPVNPYTSRVYL